MFRIFVYTFSPSFWPCSAISDHAGYHHKFLLSPNFVFFDMLRLMFCVFAILKIAFTVSKGCF